MTSLEFRMPDVGEGIAEAEIVSWLVEVGDTVAEDQPLCAVETDKSLVEIPAPAAGSVASRHGAVGDVVAVGSVLVTIDGAASPEWPRPNAGSADADSSDTEAPQTSAPESQTLQPGPRPLASPRTRRLAVERGIDLMRVRGTGPHGRILEADLSTLIPTGTAAPTDTADPTTSEEQPAALSRTHDIRHGRSRSADRADEVVPLRGLRRSIARSMTEALTIPHVTEFREIDATGLLAAHRTLKASLLERGVRLSLFPMLLQAVVRALELQSSMNSTFDAVTETVTRHGNVHLGMATATEDGLIVPVIRQADGLGLVDLALEVDRLAEAARMRTATPSDLTGGTFTVTNFGSFGTWLGTPVIRPPEVGIAGFGRITEQVVAVEGQPVVRPILPMVVATDHRIHDGSHLADFVGAVEESLADPILLLA